MAVLAHFQLDCRLEGDFRGWMLSMSLREDLTHSLRIKGIVADIQFLLRRKPGAHVGHV